MRLLLLLIVMIGSACAGEERTLKIKGSDTEVNLVAELAEEFHKANPDRYISISGGGSGLGIASLLNAQADMANSSRTLNSEEIELFRTRGIELDTFVFAEDAIAFVVSTKMSLDTISVSLLADVLSGKIRNWAELGGNDMKVNIYGRQSNSGTYEFVKKKLGIEFTNQAKEMNGNAQILEAIKADASGIGYVGAGYVMSERNKPENIKVLWIREDGAQQAYSALDSIAVFQHLYFFRRHLYQFIRRSSAAAAADFIAFEKSPAGASLIRRSGYYPLKH